MKWLASVLFTFWYTALQAQHRVQTIVPLQPIAVGAAFQVQYIVTNGEPVVELQSPAFGRDFRFVSGPRLYHGEALINNTKTPIQNFSYTLVPLRKGRLVVKGATLVFGSGKQKSDDTFVVVTDKAKDEALAATPVSDLPRLAPGTNWKRKLEQHIFIKTAVSKQNCFVGEPVVATYTLFSRLPSASEILKNPGFYGFSVLDMPDATEGTQTVQTHNGAFYNTHILRHVQLYPAQAGHLLLDKMSVTNAIEYADSASGAPVQTNVLLESEPFTIAVKPLPAAAQNFDGAVGRFSVNAWLDQPEWPQNNHGKLVVTISGSGNFLQLSAPEVGWPNGFDVFEPTVTERLQKEAVPVSGTRTYTYTFTTGGTGRFSIPPIALTYFNPAEKRYKTARTDSLHFTVREAQRRTAFPPLGIRKKGPGSPSYIGWIAAGFLVILSGILFMMRYSARKKEVLTAVPETCAPDFEKTIRQIDLADSDKYRRLQQALLGFLKSCHPQADVSKRVLVQQIALQRGNNPGEARLQEILDECEAVQYYNAAPTLPFTELQHQALDFIRSVKQP